MSFSTALLAGDALKTYPILAISRSAGADALLKYEMTAEETKLFKEMEAQTATLSKDAEHTEYRAVAARVGRKFGLTPKQSYAFFVRSTFSEFELER